MMKKVLAEFRRLIFIVLAAHGGLAFANCETSLVPVAHDQWLELLQSLASSDRPVWDPLFEARMDLLPPPFRRIRGTGGAEIQQYTEALEAFLLEIPKSERRGLPRLWAWFDRRHVDPMSVDASPLNSKIRYLPLEQPERADQWKYANYKFEKLELAKIVSVDDAVVQPMIDFAQANGAEVRLIKTRVTAQGRFIGWRPESPYFWVNLDKTSPSYLKPVIGLDLTGRRALAALAHEIEHLKVWLKVFRRFEERGFRSADAARLAIEFVWRERMTLMGERRAVRAEIATERAYPDHPFNQSDFPVATEYWHKNYLNRLTYPEFETIRVLLRKGDEAGVKRHIKDLLEQSEANRQRALAFLTEDSELRRYWAFTSAFDLLFKPFGMERLVHDKTLERFERLYDEVRAELAGAG